MSTTQTTIQIAVDCAEPHRLADFWAAAVGYEVEDHSAQIERLVADGHATDDDTTTHGGRRAWRTAAACSDPTGGRPRLLVQEVPEAKQGKNRVHLDLQVGEDRRDAEVDRLLALGAARIGEGSQGPHHWVVLADPEGNELCVG
jgi:hypothetical protein